jgi:MerR family regulatory protein
MTGGLRTGQLAERAGVNVQTLRYYERRGLLGGRPGSGSTPRPRCGCWRSPPPTASR